MRIKKQYLLFIACLVWSFAGINVFRIGAEMYLEYLNLFNVLMSAVVFIVFLVFIFGKLVEKHTRRILNYKEEKQLFIKFFDLKSFIVMAVMITAGVWIRISKIASERFIAVFYSGLGASLLTAGVLFGINFIKNINKTTNHQKGQ